MKKEEGWVGGWEEEEEEVEVGGGRGEEARRNEMAFFEA